MAGIVAAETDNGIGIAGVGYAGVTVMPVTVLGADGLGQDSDIIEGVVWAADHGADVILMAFSASGYSSALQAAIDYAWSQGVVLVAATGNDGSSTPHVPRRRPRRHRRLEHRLSPTRLPRRRTTATAAFLAAPGRRRSRPTRRRHHPSPARRPRPLTSPAPRRCSRAADAVASNGVIVGRLARNADAAGTAAQTGNGRLNLARALSDASTAP